MTHGSGQVHEPGSDRHTVWPSYPPSWDLCSSCSARSQSTSSCRISAFGSAKTRKNFCYYYFSWRALERYSGFAATMLDDDALKQFPPTVLPDERRRRTDHGGSTTARQDVPPPSQSSTTNPSIVPSLSAASLVTSAALCSMAVHAMMRSKSLLRRPRRSTSARTMA
jgi:hypothetical protein